MLYLEGDGTEGLRGPGGEPLGHGRALSDLVDWQIRETVNRACAEAFELLERERSRLDALAEALLVEETLDERRVREAVGLADRRGPNALQGVPALAR